MSALRCSSLWLCESGSGEPDSAEPKLCRPILFRWMLEATIRRFPVVCLLKEAFAQISRGAGAPLPEADWAIGLVRTRPEAGPTWVRRLRCRVGLDRPVSDLILLSLEINQTL